MARRKTMTREQFMAELEKMKRRGPEQEEPPEEKRKDEILQERDKYRHLIENLSDAVFLLRIPEGVYEYISPSVTEVFGYRAEDFYRTPLFIKDIVHPDYFDYCGEKWEDLLAGILDRHYEYKIIDPKGKERWIVQSNKGLFDPLGRLVGLLAQCRNMAVSRQMDANFRENEGRYRHIYEFAGDPILLVDRKTGAILEVNHAALDLYGYSAEEMLKLRITDLSTESEKTDLTLKSADTQRRKWYHKKKDGTVFPVEASIHSFTHKHKKLVVVVIRDVTERMRMEERLLESEARYRSLFEENIGILLLINPNTGKIVDANEAACHFYGYGKEALRMKMIDDINILSRDQLLRDMERAQRRECGHFYYLNRLSNGEVRDVESFIAPIEISGEQLLYFLLHDITDRKQMEEEMVKARKLESVGILTGGIAHDFNNLLAAILGNVALAKLNLSSEDPAYEQMLQAERICLQGKELTNRLATFAQGGGPLRKKVSIVSFLRDTVALFLSGSNVRFEFQFPDFPWPLEIDVAKMQQVIRHLLMNAQEAMPEGGVIMIRVDNVHVAPEEVPSLKEGPYLRISLQDQGVGIPRQFQGKVFDPYFTTKTVENVKGAGMGLAICYSIINKHKGYLALSSQLGVGTTFTLYLPASPDIPA